MPQAFLAGPDGTFHNVHFTEAEAFNLQYIKNQILLNPLNTLERLRAGQTPDEIIAAGWAGDKPPGSSTVQVVRSATYGADTETKAQFHARMGWPPPPPEPVPQPKPPELRSPDPRERAEVVKALVQVSPELVPPSRPNVIRADQVVESKADFHARMGWPPPPETQAEFHARMGWPPPPPEFADRPAGPPDFGQLVTADQVVEGMVVPPAVHAVGIVAGLSPQEEAAFNALLAETGLHPHELVAALEEIAALPPDQQEALFEGGF